MKVKKFKLGAICSLTSGYAWNSANFNYNNNGLPIVRIQNIPYTSNFEAESAYWNSEYEDKFTITEGDLILSLSGSIKVDIWMGPKSLLNQRIVKIECEPNIILKKYAYLLVSNHLREIENKGKKSIINNVSINSIKNLDVNIPEISEQQQILNILDKAQSLIDKRKEAIAKLDELIQALFLDMFGDLRVNSGCWGSARLLEIAEVSSGVTKGKKYNDAELVSVPYMRVANVQDGYVDLSEIKEIEVSYNDSIRYRLQSRDVLLTEGGDPDKLGRGAVWTAPIKDCIHQNHIFRVRVNEDILNPHFFSACAGSDYGKNYFLRIAKQTTGIATINMTQLKDFVVFLPPIELQNRFEQLVKTIDVKKKLMKTQLKQLENNFNALLQRAFKGELTRSTDFEE